MATPFLKPGVVKCEISNFSSFILLFITAREPEPTEVSSNFSKQSEKFLDSFISFINSSSVNS